MKSFFSEGGAKGLTSTSANYYANLAKEARREYEERLESVRFFDTQISVIGNTEQTCASVGLDPRMLGDISEYIQNIGNINSLIAFFREAIKEKERLVKEAEMWIDEEKKAYFEEKSKELYSKKPVLPAKLTEEDVVRTWSIGEQEKYLSLEAQAAAIGKYIHEKGRLSEARRQLMSKIHNPTFVETNGRDTIIHRFTPTVSLSLVDELFFSLQSSHRDMQAELNGMKKRIQDTIDQHNLETTQQYKSELENWKILEHDLQVEMYEWGLQEKIERAKRVTQARDLKICIPHRLEPVFQMLQNL